MKAKLYFSDIDEGFCLSKKWLLDEMKEREIESLNIALAVREVNSDYFTCLATMELGEKDDSCGKMCQLYAPRNGKSGCCKHFSGVYFQGEKLILNINGKITKP